MESCRFQYVQYAGILWLMLMGWVDNAHAQTDTAYYSYYPRRISGRAYFSNKYTSLRFKNAKDGYDLRFQPNTSVNIGIGATYKWATLNLGIGILNRNPTKGRTRYLDLQFHNYGRKFTLDILGQFYNGFYLYPKGKGGTDGNFYKRPDLHVNEYGASFQYIFNYRKFSYRSSFLQNEWQKKSAGSFLAGVETFYGRIIADSTIVPHGVSPAASMENIRYIRFFEIGPNAGYAYTFVFRRHYFLTGSGTVSLDYGGATIRSDTREYRTQGFSPNSTVRFCAGYNSSRNGISVLYVNSAVKGTSGNALYQVALNTGNIRLIFVHRFLPNAKERKALKVIK